MNPYISEKQQRLFDLLSQCGELVFACGRNGVTANLVGEFRIRKNHHGEDQLDVGDGTNHVHVDWSKVIRFEVGDFHGEGLLTVFDESESIFRFYRPVGAYPSSIKVLAGSLAEL